MNNTPETEEEEDEWAIPAVTGPFTLWQMWVYGTDPRNLAYTHNKGFHETWWKADDIFLNTGWSPGEGMAPPPEEDEIDVEWERRKK